MNKLFKYLSVAIFGAIAFASSALAQSNDSFYVSRSKALGFIRFAELEVADQVTDNCWTNVSAIRAKTRLLLEQNGIAVVDLSGIASNFVRPYILLNVVGFSTANGCAGYANIEVYYFASDAYAGGGGLNLRVFSRPFYRGTLFTSGQNLNDQLDEFFEGAASELLAEAIAARRDPKVDEFFEEYNFLTKLPEATDQ